MLGAVARPRTASVRHHFVNVLKHLGEARYHQRESVPRYLYQILLILLLVYARMGRLRTSFARQLKKKYANKEE